jgi:hypothetical protein
VSENEEEDVGYKKPPKSAQWKPGQSGNPNGRPKKVKDFFKLFDQTLSQLMQVTEGGEVVTISKREALLKLVVHNALRNDKTSLKLVFDFMKADQAIEEFAIDDKDREALMELFERAKLEDAKPEEPEHE